jgi:hypothetical protein
MFSERKMGTPTRLMVPTSVKRDQPTIKETGPYVAGWNIAESPIEVISRLRR